MKFLVTGASGFVGSYLVKTLKQQGHTVFTIVRAPHKSQADKTFIESDLTDDDAWYGVLSHCDVVVHLAARVHVMNEASDNPLEDFLAVNLHNMLAFAKHAARANVKRFVYVSSVKVNGECTAEAIFSEASQPEPQDPYAISKYRAEIALMELSKNTGMEVVVVRPPLVYGPQVKANFLTLMKIVNKKIPLPFKSINNRRSLVYVGNLVDALITCATHSNAARKTFLVSDGEDVSTPDLMIKIAKALSKPSRVFYFPISPLLFLAQLIGKKTSIDRLTQSLVVDSSKIRKELEWQPPYSMDEGLKVTANWYIENLKAIKR